jgi:NADH-quinone oxidoreductase subunit C
MSRDESLQSLGTRITQRFGAQLTDVREAFGELTVTVVRDHVRDVATALRDDPEFAFHQLIDLCGVDYLEYPIDPHRPSRYAVVYHLLSVDRNERLRMKSFLDDEQPRIDSLIDVWAVANWYEREAFDLFGILFDGHPDLRRLLTDYGFIGHPFRKDFPLSGNVEMRYDPERQRVVYEPVTIEPRINIPRVVRHDNRYLVEPLGEDGKRG